MFLISTGSFDLLLMVDYYYYYYYYCNKRKD